MLLRARQSYLPYAAFLIGFLPFFLEPLFNAAPIAWPNWPGPVKGLEISILDCFALAIIAATPRIPVPAALKIGAAIILAALMVSTLAATQAMPSLFYGWQFLRACLLFVAIARASAANPSVPVAILAGLGCALLIEAVIASSQFLRGAVHAGGNMGHQNLLGMTSHFAVMPAFAMLLAGKRSFLFGSVVIAGAVIALVGGSRATIGLFALGLLITSVLSIRHRLTGRKISFAFAAVAALVLAAPAMWWAIERRPESVRQSSNQERQALTQAARMIIVDHPLGVGANQYVVVANVGGYSDRAGVAWNVNNRSAPVHNTYYLVTAELGLLGLLGFLTVLLTLAFRGLWRSGNMPASINSEAKTGILATIIVVSAHCAFEWVFMTFQIHYLFAIHAGTLTGLLAAERRSSMAARRAAWHASHDTRSPRTAHIS